MFKRSHRLAAVIAALTILSACSSSDPTLDLKVRQDYQTQLDNQPNTFDADSGIYVENDKLFVASSALNQSCERHCATFEQTSDGYKVYLPVGFQTARDESTAAKIAGPVVELVYWDPIQHGQRTLEGALGDPILVPGALVRRTTDDLKMDESAYIATSYVHPKTGEDEAWIIETAPIWYEPVGLEYNMTVVVHITRTKDGIDVCVPQRELISKTEISAGLPVVSLSYSC